jgi:CheY-like chemotaxis protein
MSHRLLLVAAEHAPLRTLVNALGNELQLQIFASPNQALWAVRKEPPDLLLAELDLPELSGLEVAEILPNFEAPTRMLLYSSSNGQLDRAAEAAGVFRCLHGDLSVAELRAAIQAALAPSPPAAGVATPPPTPTLAQRVERTKVAATTPPTDKRSSAEQPQIDPTEAATGTDTTAWISSGGKLIITAQKSSTARSIIEQLAQDLGTQSVLLADRAGMLLIEVGTTSNIPVPVMLSLLSTGFSTTSEVARQLHEEDALNVYIHEGSNIDLYCFDLVRHFLLILIFDKRIASSKIGSVWINAKRAIRALRETLLPA